MIGASLSEPHIDKFAYICLSYPQMTNTVHEHMFWSDPLLGGGHFISISVLTECWVCVWEFNTRSEGTLRSWTDRDPNL